MVSVLGCDDVANDEMKVRNLQQAIVGFHANEGRKFPWRETTDPYVVLVSEILLQKTTSKQVLDVFWDFFEKFPTINSLSKANTKEIESFVQQLGLAKRAEFLKDLACAVVSKLSSQIPDNIEDLLKLKGVGQYTANAVLCFAFSKKMPLVDSNIARLLRRYFDIESDRPAYADKTLWKLAQKILPNEKYREFNYGLLDLAAKLCHPKAPECDACPLKKWCSFPSRN